MTKKLCVFCGEENLRPRSPYCSPLCCSKEYYQTERGKATRKKHSKTEKRKISSKRYQDSEKGKNAQLKYNYGITLDEYNKMKESCGNKCMICGKSEMKNIDLSVDHHHGTKKIRGLLCGKCNRLLGLCNDDISILKSAIIYLS